MADNPYSRPEIRAAFEEAKQCGFSNIEVDDQQFTVVLPGVNPDGGELIFNGAEQLISPPKARSAYSDRMAWVMAELSRLAYKTFEKDEGQKSVLLKTLNEGGFQKTEFFTKKDGTQAFLTVRPREMAVLAFRGTEKNRRDILKDLDANFYATKDGKAHRGFATAFEGIERDIRDALDKNSVGNIDVPLFVTGHSLGGAIATAATQALEEEYLISACYTFGSPRVGTAEWSESVKSPLYRIVNGADGVPLVPLSGISKTVILWLFSIPFLNLVKPFIEKFFSRGFAGFQHVGDMRFIILKDDKARLLGGSAAAWARFLHVTVGTLARGLLAICSALGFKGLSAFFADHSIGEYASILKKIAEQRNPRK